jgi:uroporphyrinogen decarboxylase
LQRVRAALDPQTALIGFCGAPWTIATYMIAGRGTPDQAPARLFAYRHREDFSRLIDLLARVCAQHLVRQIDAGAQAVQIFDSWAGVLPDGAFEAWSLAPIARIAKEVRASRPHARIIAFPRGASPARTAAMARCEGIDCVGLDTAADLASVHAAVAPDKTLQGNLDPLLLLAGGRELDEAVDRIVAALADRPHVFNLGHGILPPTPIPHVEAMLKRLRGG